MTYRVRNIGIAVALAAVAALLVKAGPLAVTLAILVLGAAALALLAQRTRRKRPIVTDSSIATPGDTTASHKKRAFEKTTKLPKGR